MQLLKDLTVLTDLNKGQTKHKFIYFWIHLFRLQNCLVFNLKYFKKIEQERSRFK